MKTLYVTATNPWPVNSGNRRRIQALVRAVSRSSDVDVLVLNSASHDQRTPEPVHGRVGRGPDPQVAPTGRQKLAWFLTRPKVPSELVGIDPSPTIGALGRWLETTSARYDLVWYDRPISYLALGPMENAVEIVDFDDLEDRKLEDRLEAAGVRDGLWAGPRVPGWRMLARHKTRRNVAGWRSLQTRIAGDVAHVVVCSEEDRIHSGLSNAVVVPNSYPEPSAPLGRIPVGSVPTLTFVGLLSYRPNADAVEWFVREVFPLVRQDLPSSQLRIVGEAPPRIRALARIPGVTVTGFVERLDDEIGCTDLAIAPVRFGGGTRIKILEAWAHRVPVVATTVGAAGLGAEHETHLLIADDPRGFAEACVVALIDLPLRERLADFGERRYRENFSPMSIDRTIARLLGVSTPRVPADRDVMTSDHLRTP